MELITMNVLSLFDGMSCGQIALNRLGVDVNKYYASELDKYAITVTQANFPKTIQLGDVCGVNPEKLDKIDLLIGGSPCQGFSFAGKQLAFDDPRSALFFEYVRVLERCKELNPNVKFMLENVKMKKEYLDVITKILGVEPVFINSSLVSAQNRQRYYWTNIEELRQPEDKGILLADILQDEVHEKFYHSNKALEYMNRTGSTGRIKWSYGFHSEKRKGKSACVTANFHKGVPNNALVLCGAMRGRYVKDGIRQDGKMKVAGLTKQRLEVRYDGKTNAITTVQKDNNAVLNPDDRKNFNLDDVVFRRFTPVECERLQTVPDNYTNHVSNTQRYRMLGNGWTVDVITHIFKTLKLDRVADAA